MAATEIKRYDFVDCGSDFQSWKEMRQEPQGDWVRWEDVKDLIPTKPRAMTSEDIQRGMEHVINMSGSEFRPVVINSPNFVNLNELSLKERSK